MKITDIISEAVIGTNPKRPSREGSRPERGHEPQKRYVTDRKTGKQYDPDEEFDKLKNSDEFKAQMKRMATKEGVAETLPMSGYGRVAGKGEQGVEEAGNKALEPHIGMGDSRTPRELKTQMKGASDEFVKSNAGKKPGVFHSKVAHMQSKLAKSELRKRDQHMEEMEQEFAEAKAPRSLCVSSKPDEDLGASQLASCKSQGLRARDGNKSHKLGKTSKSRVKVGGKRIKGDKYGGPLPDWS